NYTRFEALAIASVQQALKGSTIDVSTEKTIFILSTTKGNIALSENNEVSAVLYERISLFYSAKIIAHHFNNPNIPVVISNACISGIASMIYAKRMLENGVFENAVIVGADTISKFVYSGFKSFHALSKDFCKPFSFNRDGINLGEAAATIILTTSYLSQNKIVIKAGTIGNDANHLSGPSKTGEELSLAIDKCLLDARISVNEIGFISAHGTATPYNDEMEAKAFHLSNLNDVPVNSLKGNFGHTLGAAGLLETIMSIISLHENVILQTHGFTKIGVPVDITICSEPIEKEMRSFIKTASGFGGCHAAAVFEKVN
ncbi:MAG TPA: beta-ketoacyl synthase N-terminal-like domain-containing protein, partial [Chitinophagales bacterium]|nr:beta-ketoacyl synthase N-terminal-like domain-containing protein [Chitinophagales bacterium]